jgi:hypothetical protein
MIAAARPGDRAMSRLSAVLAAEQKRLGDPLAR